MTIAYLNGKFLPLEEARISPMDRGFLFGDGVYEVIPVYNGHAFRLKEHLTRLNKSLSEIRLSIDLNEAQLSKIIEELIHRNGDGDQSLYLQYTRGVAPVREHHFPEKTRPTLFAYSVPLIMRSYKELSQGVKTITLPDDRWLRCDIKAITLLANVLGRQAARDKSAYESILIRDGLAIEGAASNLFIVKNNIIITPPLSSSILGGITRDVILEIAKKHAISYQERNITEKELFTADEIWLTSSSREILPVIQVNQQMINQGKAGPLWSKMIHWYQAFKQETNNT